MIDFFLQFSNVLTDFFLKRITIGNSALGLKQSNILFFRFSFVLERFLNNLDQKFKTVHLEGWRGCLKVVN